MDFWLSVMGYNAPESRIRGLARLLPDAPTRSRPAAETVAAMTLAITMNPYFLLHQ